jgi:hypothetical protein
MDNVNADKVVAALKATMARTIAYYSSQADGFGTHGLLVYQQIGFKTAEDAALAKDDVYPTLAAILKAGEE